MLYRNQKLSETKVFKDPVHRYVHVRDQVIWDLIGTEEFQRLRRIKQLGTTYFTFHGAEHSRFGHSLGVYEIIRRMIDDVFTGREAWNDDDRLLCLCAALLHDVGHGPFSHAYEKVFKLNHEEFTQKIILGDTEIHAVLTKVSTTFPQEVAEVIGKTSKNKLVTSMISSQIDADRMDYLLRDAHFTGVSYGNFDLERLLRVMRPQQHQVVIKHSGMHAVEHYIMSRYQMYWQIYFHPVSRSAEVILAKILHRAKKLHHEYYNFKHEPIHFYSIFAEEVTLEDYIKLDEAVMTYYFHMWQEEDDAILSDLCRRFLNRKFFQYVDFTDKWEVEEWSELLHLFKEANIDPAYYLVVDSTSDLPYDFYREGEGEERLPILLLMPSGELRELSRESYIVEAISGKKQTDKKLFYPHDLIYNGEDNRDVKDRIIRLLESK
ncbi:HD domain-containing protein [Priestia taiwanensis]|uniref:HD domain-containing protein n=1 Tax=Priestia taiwanensis TaxID=1347902 RepID=A0A917ERN4_9BACI|nr:HD domain-containing protein [Priestia taiwanensis]MBM7364941.1 HD superfamily phosphohydrolase [Priestia taiwanensis]GGE82343.1 HD domain-containing protein [Priestia taiwanensis]